MKKLHNKKRNVGILYEQIINYICEQSIHNDFKSINKATSILNKYFKNTNQLKKEYRLFKALSETRGINSSLGVSIIHEAKKACNYHFDPKELEIEKSNLIKELNYSFGKNTIFNKKVDNFKIYATIQTLLNEWRKKSDKDLSVIANYENVLLEWVTGESSTVINEDTPAIDYSNVDSFVVDIMNENFNKKYSNKLLDEQKELIRMYSADDSSLCDFLSEIKKTTLSALIAHKKECDNNTLLESYDVVLDNINNLNCSLIKEDNIKRFLSLSKLKSEILGE